MGMLEYGFMQRAFGAGAMIAAIAPILGVYLMLRRQALLADTLSHVSLAGAALGTFLPWNPSFTGVLAAIVGGMIVEHLRRTYRTYREVPVAIVMTSGLALAIVLMSSGTNIGKNFSSYLFGSIVAVNETQLWLIAGVAIMGAVYFICFRRPLYSITFDEETARIGGVRSSLLSFSFSLLTGMTVAAAMPIVGVMLVSALMVLPAALALRVAKGFASAVATAACIGTAGMFSGLTVSYYVNIPPGGTIALVLLLFLLSGIGVQKITLRINRRKKSLRTAMVQQKRITGEKESLFL